MSLIVKGQGQSSFTPHPTHSGPVTCIDVQDLGWFEDKKWDKWVYRIRLVFWAGMWTEPKEVDGDTKKFPMLVMQRFTASLSDKAHLRKFCRDWRGQDFTPDVLRDGFDFDKMCDAPGFGQITQAPSADGQTIYANITVLKLSQGMGEAPGIPEGYVRLKDRPEWEGPARHPDMSTPDPDQPPVIEDDDGGLPF